MKNWFLFFIIITAVLIIGSVFDSSKTKPTETDLSSFISSVKDNQVKNIEVNNLKLTFELNNGDRYVTYKDRSEADLAKDYGVNYETTKITTKSGEDSSGQWVDLAISFLPVLILVGFFYMMMRQAQGSNSQALSFGRSKAKIAALDQKKYNFEMVAGNDEAKVELQEIVEFLKQPKKFQALGAKIPKGALLIGAPGTGKTLLARAVAGEAEVPFYSISGSEFVEMFVGVGASRVRDLFARAKKTSPCIIFIDEIDAVGRQRGTGLGGGHDEREQTLNQILVEMDGFDQDHTVIVLAATNRPDVLDPALLRPGRFDRRITIDMPDLKAREQIIKIHNKNKPLDGKINTKVIAQKTSGLSGADLGNVVNEAAIFAARANRKVILDSDYHHAIEKIALGPERKTHVLSDEEKKITAFHEAGHSIVAHFLPKCHPVHKVTIVSRGMAGGVTWSLPEEDKHLNSLDDYRDELALCMGGRIAEELIFTDFTTGASNDLEHANHIARKMVTQFGMSKDLPYQVFGDGQSNSVFLGRRFAEGPAYSDETAAKIDQAIAHFVVEAASRAKEVINKHRDKLEAVAKRLIEVETIERDEFLAMMA